MCMYLIEIVKNILISSSAVYPEYALILRPPYLYGEMNNVYREAFVFDCALADRKFYLPKDGDMKLQFFHIHDLCRFIDVLLKVKPSQHIFNVGNKEVISIRKWVEESLSLNILIPILVKAISLSTMCVDKDI